MTTTTTTTMTAATITGSENTALPSNTSNDVCFFHWADSNARQPCFCSTTTIDWPVSKRPTATPETLAALFGVYGVDQQPERCIVLKDRSSGTKVPLNDEDGSDTCWWMLQGGHHYDVHVIVGVDGDGNDETKNASSSIEVTPINCIFQLLPGDTDDAKSDALEKLSNAFYDLIWNDPETPTEFRDTFVNRFSTASIQAFRQYDWFHEVFGGPALDANCDRLDHLQKKMMAKHTRSRMKPQHAVTWLRLMDRAVDANFAGPKHAGLRRALGLYWLHFYAFFPFEDHDRRTFRTTVFDENTKK